MPNEFEPGKWQLFKGEFISGQCSGTPIEHVHEFPHLNLVSIRHYKGVIELQAPNFLSAVQKLQTP